jgi:poly(A) polymerase
VTTIISFIKRLLRQARPVHPKPSEIDSKYLIPRQNHRLSKAHISPNALKVIHRLNTAGFQAYIVGGSVRDLLLNKQPKDFDVSTNATPAEIRKLFKNSRLIGRRFKLVHVWFYRETIEVATFRASQATDENHVKNERGMLIRDNVYGTLLDDAWRRDFTINALYYGMEDGAIIDITEGVKDIEQRVLRMIGEPSVRYEEDPVRMLRAVRFAAKLGFSIEPKTQAPLYQSSALIRHIAPSRLFDEITKLYQCGQAQAAQSMMMEYNLFAQLFPYTHALLNQHYPVESLVDLALKSTDARIREEKPVTPAFLFAIFLWFPLQAKAAELQTEHHLPPLHALEQAMSVVLAEQNRIISIPRRFTQIMREIWILQYRFQKRLGGRAQHLLTHPRFRAAYDMLALRALAQDAPIELADWWTEFQEVDEQTKQDMVQALIPVNTNKPKKKKKKKPAAPPTSPPEL